MGVAFQFYSFIELPPSTDVSINSNLSNSANPTYHIVPLGPHAYHDHHCTCHHLRCSVLANPANQHEADRQSSQGRFLNTHNHLQARINVNQTTFSNQFH